MTVLSTWVTPRQLETPAAGRRFPKWQVYAGRAQALAERGRATEASTCAAQAVNPTRDAGMTGTEAVSFPARCFYALFTRVRPAAAPTPAIRESGRRWRARHGCVQLVESRASDPTTWRARRYRSRCGVDETSSSR